MGDTSAYKAKTFDELPTMGPKTMSVMTFMGDTSAYKAKTFDQLPPTRSSNPAVVSAGKGMSAVSMGSQPTMVMLSDTSAYKASSCDQLPPMASWSAR
jgi:hypothetical protein